MSEDAKRGSFPAEEVKRIQFDVDCGTLKIKASEEEGTILTKVKDTHGGDFSAQLVDGTLSISYKTERKHNVFHTDDVKITVRLPKKEFEGIHLQIGAGKAKIKAETELNCNWLTAKVGAGSLQAENVHVTGVLRAEVGAGQVSLHGMQAGSLDADCAVGEFVYSGAVNGNVDIDCGVGSCKVRLDAAEDDYNYDLNGGLIGQVSINGSKSINVANRRTKCNGGPVLGTVRVSCAVGAVEVRTA